MVGAGDVGEGNVICDLSLAYWMANGGLAEQGYPISPGLDELHPALSPGGR